MFLITDMKFLSREKYQKGVSMVEMVVYISILALVSIVVINALYSLGRSYQSMRRAEVIETTAQVALERMVREIRDASSVDVSDSQFNDPAGSLTINTLNEAETLTAVRFYLLDGRIRVEEDGVDMGPLSPADATVTELVFNRITTAESEAVKMDMTVESARGVEVQSKKFYSTVVLRGSYLP
jgi:hypothetical protein